MLRRHFAIGLLILTTLPWVPASAQEAKKPGSGSTLKVACVGDSITYGAGIKDRENHSYPKQLARMLGDGFLVENFGVSGATLLKKGDRPYWKTGKYKGALALQPDIVVIKLGTNDTKPKNWKHKDQIAADLKAMVGAFRELPSKPVVFLCLPVPAFPERWGIRDSVIKSELIPIIKEVAKSEKCPVIDLYKALDGKRELFPDKVHPNQGGAKVIAETVNAAIGKQLSAHPEKKPAATKAK